MDITPPTIAPGLRQLALSVARCPEIPSAHTDASHPCRLVVRAQEPGQTWQVPEAWAGNLTSARIAFVSSNPSISVPKPGADPLTAERYPDMTWHDDAVADFVVRRFERYATADGRFLQRDGAWSPRRTKFWRNVRVIAADVIGREADPGRDYVMTEVVHCKSKDELGVAQASRRCAERHLDRVLSFAPAPLVVVLGTKALHRVRGLWQLPGGMNPGKARTQGPLVTRTIGGRERLVAYLPHPSNYGAVVTLSIAYAAHVERLRALVRELDVGDLRESRSRPDDERTSSTLLGG